jgi:hypothetical protein
MVQDTIRSLFLNNGPLRDHLKHQKENYYEYISILLSLFNCGIDLAMLTKAHVITAALARNDKELATRLLSMEQFGLLEVLKMCKILDSKRYIKQLTKKVNKLTSLNAKKNKIAVVKRELDAVSKFNSDINVNLSLSGAKAKFIRDNWVKKIPKEKLELDAMMLPMDYWKQLSNFIHIKASDFQLNWFLAYVYGTPAPVDSILHNCKNINNTNALDIMTKYKPNYNYIRQLNKDQKCFTMTDTIKRVIAEYTKLDTVLWYWEELTCRDVDYNIIERLAKGEKLNLTYGKLMERLLVVKSKHCLNLYSALLIIAETKLKEFNICLEQPVVVLGDASASMEVAIKTSSIVMSLLCAICNAEMRLFRDTDELIKDPPKSVKDVITLSQNCRAQNCTAPAASLYPYYAARKVIKTFIIVTDEEENTEFAHYTFASLFREYRANIYPAKLAFISFTKTDNDGQMISALKTLIPGVEKDIMKFRMDPKRPDLTKLDTLLSSLASQTEKFKADANELAKKLEKEQLYKVKQLDNTTDKFISI